MEDMSKYYFSREELVNQVELLDKYLQNSEEYKNQGLKIIASYCKPLILTNKGIEYGLELVNKYRSGLKLNRKELFDLYIIGTEANLIASGKGTYELLAKTWKELYERYKPDVDYLQSYIYEVMFIEGYMQGNPSFTEILHKTVKNYTEERPALKAIFFTIDIHIMRRNDVS